MSYQVLARKWRPRNFASLVGQEHVVKALTHALAENRLHHAYLFTGTRGVGKTTLARILAKSLNCEKGITPEPCGECSACKEIDSGRFVDLLEVDAATNTRVDEMRMLLENAVYAPTRGRFKVYVIDEVHMLSNSAFNAMLKTLEEPPEHVKFILATTDPQKIPVTVLSRCLQFNLKQMPINAIVDHLAYILGQEQIPFEGEGLTMLARSANGSMRDALSLLDQAIAYGSGKVESGLVREMLGTVDRGHLMAILNHVLAGEGEALVQVASDMAAQSLSFNSALEELAVLATQIQVAQLAPGALPPDAPDREALQALAERFDPEGLQLAYQILIQGRKDLPLAPDPYSGFLVTLLRLLTFSPAKGLGAPPPETPVKKASSAERPGSRSTPSPQEPSPAPRAAQVATPAPEAAGEQGVPASWEGLLRQLDIGGMARELAQNCLLDSLVEGAVNLRLAQDKSHLLLKASQDKLREALQTRLGRPVSLHIQVGDVAGDTPAIKASKARKAKLAQATEALAQDSFVNAAVQLLDATLIQSSIKPL